jgi:hypothetical protein
MSITLGCFLLSWAGPAHAGWYELIEDDPQGVGTCTVTSSDPNWWSGTQETNGIPFSAATRKGGFSYSASDTLRFR